MVDSGIGCLVNGSPRSGTTLCASMVGSHPDIGMHMEDLRHSVQPVLGVKVWGNKLCIPNQITLNIPPDSRSVLKRLEDGIRVILGRPRWGKDWPSPIHQRTIRNYVDEGARLVAAIRDPDHIVDSIRRRGNVTLEEGKMRWSRAVHTIWQVWRDYGEITCLLRFFDLVNNPEGTMREVCHLLELPYSERMAEGYKHTPQYDHDCLDPSVATRDVRSYDLKEFDPKAFDMHTELAQQAAQKLSTSPSQ